MEKDYGKEEYDKLPTKFKQELHLLVLQYPELIEQIVMSAFIAGMELSIRICRNRAKEYGERSRLFDRERGAQSCAAVIRNVQVEIGSRRMQRPEFTNEEMEEMDRIS